MTVEIVSIRHINDVQETDDHTNQYNDIPGYTSMWNDILQEWEIYDSYHRLVDASPLPPDLNSCRLFSDEYSYNDDDDVLDVMAYIVKPRASRSASYKAPAVKPPVATRTELTVDEMESEVFALSESLRQSMNHMVGLIDLCDRLNFIAFREEAQSLLKKSHAERNKIKREIDNDLYRLAIAIKLYGDKISSEILGHGSYRYTTGSEFISAYRRLYS